MCRDWANNLNNGPAAAGNWALGVPVGRTSEGGETLCCQCGMSVFLISGKGMVVRAVKQRITAGRWQQEEREKDDDR